jgi:hypothetical protein
LASGRGVNVDQQLITAVQDYLTYVYDEYSQNEQVKLWAKSMLIYGYAFAKISYKVETFYAVEYDEKGKKSIKKEILGQYPNIEVLSFMDMFYDPRYRDVDDMPAIASKSTNVRLSELYKNKKSLFNL